MTYLSRIPALILYPALLLLVFRVQAQTPGQNKSLLLHASVQANPAQITLHWQPPANATGFDIYRKNKSALNWGFPIVSGLPGNSDNWTDSDVQAGNAYEYAVVKTGGTVAYGYIYAGIDLPEQTWRGQMLLVYDTLTTQSLQPAIRRWIRDVEGDGWQVIPIGIDPGDAVSAVKSRIQDAYNRAPQQVKSAFLLGRVPVPYSGLIAPDGHTPDHLGAWPTDGYYADINGNWTDVSINNSGASQARNRNVPGDGKFDQNIFPSDLELQIGRVDMRNLPAFGLSETQLLKRYLDKNHAYRNKHFSAQNRALVDDNFTGMAEGFSASGWRSFGPICGPANVAATDYFGAMRTDSYQWSYGCGAGSYTSCSGVGNASNFAADSLRSVFTMLFGSYFGDWDSPSNNLLRAALANGSTLSNCWAGRPFWHLHHMALGETLGFSAITSMNNSSTYDANFGMRGVHTALMGDPSLRAHIVAPPHTLEIAQAGNDAELRWAAAADTVLGYNIYRRAGGGAFEKVNAAIVTDTAFSDPCLPDTGEYHYMVRAVRREITPSGSYFNLSTGISDTLRVQERFPAMADFSYTVANDTQFTFVNRSQNAIRYQWSFGDGNSSSQDNPTHTYARSGLYPVSLVALSPCGNDTFQLVIDILVASREAVAGTPTRIYPNPGSGTFYIESASPMLQLSVFDMMGSLVYAENFKGRTLSHVLNLNASPGMYNLRIQHHDNRVQVYRLVLRK